MTDAIDLSSAILTPNTVADRAMTTEITRLDLFPNSFHVEFDKREGPNRWPDTPWGNPGDSLQYTLWIGARLADRWHLAACLNVWHGLDTFGGPAAHPEQYSQNLWYLDGALGQHTPVVGEPLAFFVTQGGDRGTDAHTVRERSNVVVVPMPGPAGFSYSFTPTGPTSAPVPTPVDPAAPPVSSFDTAAVLAAIADLRDHLDAQNAENRAAISAGLAAVKFPSYSAVLFGTKFTLTPGK